jgi:hypothetical protein
MVDLRASAAISRTRFRSCDPVGKRWPTPIFETATSAITSRREQVAVTVRRTASLGFRDGVVDRSTVLVGSSPLPEQCGS